MFLAKKEEMVPVAQTHALDASHTRFRNGSHAATKWCETTPNMSVGPKVVDWLYSLRKKKKWFRWHKLMPCMHPHARFRSRSRAATKLDECTQNMSFGPKEVD